MLRKLHTLRTLAIAGTVAIALPFAPASAGFEEGKAAYEQGKDKLAFNEFRQAAEAGDMRSQIMLATLYLEGRGTEQNFSKAYEWLISPAERGNASAQFSLGLMHEHGLGAEKALPMALALYHLSALTNPSDENPAVKARARLEAEMNPAVVDLARYMGARMGLPGKFREQLEGYFTKSK